MIFQIERSVWMVYEIMFTAFLSLYVNKVI